MLMPMRSAAVSVTIQSRMSSDTASRLFSIRRSTGNMPRLTTFARASAATGTNSGSVASVLKMPSTIPSASSAAGYRAWRAIPRLSQLSTPTTAQRGTRTSIRSLGTGTVRPWWRSRRFHRPSNKRTAHARQRLIEPCVVRAADRLRCAGIYRRLVPSPGGCRRRSTAT